MLTKYLHLNFFAIYVSNQNLFSYDKLDQIRKVIGCNTPLLKECLQHQRHKKDFAVTPRTCSFMGEGIRVNLV